MDFSYTFQAIKSQLETIEMFVQEPLQSPAKVVHYRLCILELYEFQSLIQTLKCMSSNESGPNEQKVKSYFLSG